MIPLTDRIPARRFPVVNVALIVANFAVFLLYELPDLDAAIRRASFYPCDVTGACHLGIPWTVSWMTSMFMHGNWHHILGNMVFLAVFGKNVEVAFGALRYLAFYLAGGFAATVLQTAMILHFGTAADAQSANLGASGAIAAVLGAYIVLLPGARILAVWPSAVAIPAWAYLGIWFLYQLFEGNFALVHPDNSSGSHVAFFAHVGGFVFGALVALILTRTGRVTSVPTETTDYDRKASERLSETAPQRTPSAPRNFTNVGCPNCAHVQAVPLSQLKFVCEQCEAHLMRRTEPDSDAIPALPSSCLGGSAPPGKSTKVRCIKCQHVQTVPVSEAIFKCAECGAKLQRRTQSDSRRIAAFSSASGNYG